MPVRVRSCRSLDEYRAALRPIGHYVGWEPGEEEVERFSRLLPPERLHAVFEDGAVVAGAGVFPFRLSVPGGEAACAGVTVVGVLPSHRRRGLLTRMMGAQLQDVRARGEPLAALWASDERIYGRYGYGLASLMLELKVPRASAEFRAELAGRHGAVRLVDHDEAVRIFPQVYDRVRASTPGLVSRSRAWWEDRILSDSERRRRGAGPLNRALLEVDGRPSGYALYRIKRGEDFTGTVRVDEALALDARSSCSVWRFLFGIDWMDEVTAWLLPVDHPLVLQAARVSQLGLKLHDGLWLRLVDVGAALAARGYAGDGAVTLEVTTDPLFPDNVGRWTVEGGAARRTRRRPDVLLDVRGLAAAYLGGFTFTELARAELVEEATRGGLARADALFRTDVAPWCPEGF